MDIRNQITELLQINADKLITLAWSGGKDSQALLSLVLSAYIEGGLTMPIYILHSTTLQDTPNMKSYIAGQIADIRAYVKRHRLNIQLHVVQPEIGSTMWTKSIGRGTQLPLNSAIKWCTTDLKLNPMKRFISELNPDGEHSLSIVGVREEESDKRTMSIKANVLDAESNLLASQDLNSTIYAPLRKMTTEKVWEIIRNELKHTDPQKVEDVYHQTSSQDASLRSGCMFCPIVGRDKYLEEYVKSEPVMRHVLRGRNYLVKFREPAHKESIRHNRRKGRAGKSEYVYDADKKNFWHGVYTRKAREHMLRVVLTAQKRVQEELKDFCWITPEELARIDYYWKTEFLEYESQVYFILRDVYGEHKDWFPAPVVSDFFWKFRGFRAYLNHYPNDQDNETKMRQMLILNHLYERDVISDAKYVDFADEINNKIYPCKILNDGQQTHEFLARAPLKKEAFQESEPVRMSGSFIVYNQVDSDIKVFDGDLQLTVAPNDQMTKLEVLQLPSEVKHYISQLSYPVKAFYLLDEDIISLERGVVAIEKDCEQNKVDLTKVRKELIYSDTNMTGEYVIIQGSIEDFLTA